MTINRLRRGGVIAGALAGALVLSGCMTATPYQPARGVGFSRTGYSEERIEPNRFLVTFAGNSVTDRDTVERYLLFRAAELTVQNGFDHFVMVQRDTDRQARVYSTPGIGSGWGYGGFGGFWGPSWRYHGRGFGWRAWDPFLGDPFWGNTVDVRTVDRYEASAEIVMRKGAPGPDDVRAFNARAVVDTIGPKVVLPKTN